MDESEETRRRHGSLHVLAATLILLAMSCSSLTPPAPVDPDMLLIEVDVAPSPIGASLVVLAEFTNRGSIPLAFSQTFGFGRSAWIGIRVRDEDGEDIRFYLADEDIFHKPPYRCIRPGEGVSWSIDLWEWRAEVGGSNAQEGDSYYTFSPPPGRYELQVQYAGSGEVARGCREIQGIARSNWVPYTVVASAGGNDEFTKAELEQAWVDLLDDAVSGDEEARDRIERARAEGGHEAIRKLADLLRAEWDLPHSDERFETAALVWLPDIDFAALPPYALEVSSPRVVISGSVTPTGSLQEVELVKSSGSALIDQAALDSAGKALFRPARQELVYTASRAAITVHVDPR